MRYQNKETASVAVIFQNITIGLAVSFVAISLGASLGILSGRGAFAGMISAGVIALMTSLFGGTRIQCSGPTAPMSAVSAVAVAYAVSEYDALLSPDQFITLSFLLMSGLLIAGGALRLGRFITLIPNVVISGFMSGIALLIWSSQIDALFGLGGTAAIAGPWLWNAFIAGMTVALIFVFPALLKKTLPRLALYLPGTLLAIIFASLFAHLLQLPIAFTSLDGGAGSLADFVDIIKAQWPAGAGFRDVALALPFALQLALLCYLDTLLTSLVIDRMTGEKTHQNKELAAQGLASGAAAMIGGIPGAQATIRSVLMVKESATLRLAGICVGLFILIELFLFQDWFSYIPASVFSGVLFKVGYDVFDWKPLILYLREGASRVSHAQMGFVAGTMFVTYAFDLNAAVIGFTALFYVLRRFVSVGDLIPLSENEGISDEP